MLRSLISYGSRWPILVALGLALGLAVGFGVVEAGSTFIYQVNSGTNNYPGPGTNNYDEIRYYATSGSMPSHGYDQRWRVYADQAYPLATEARLISGVYKYGMSDDSKACLYKTLITTEAGSNTRYSYAWWGVTVKEGMYAYRYINWSHDDFHSGDKNLNVSQYMAVPRSDDDCSGGMNFGGYVFHQSNWEVY